MVSLRDIPLFRGALPTKMFEAMAARRPLVLAARGEAAEMVERDGSGTVVAPEDPKALADVLRRLAHASETELRSMGDNGRRTAQSHDLPDGIERWRMLLEGVASPTPAPPPD